MNKSGNITDVGYLMVFLFACLIGFVILHYSVGEMTTSLVNQGSINSSATAVMSFESMRTMSNKMDYIGFGVFIGFVLGIMITGWFVGGNPLFAFIYFLALVVFVIVSAALSNGYESFISKATVLASSSTHFPIMSHLMTNLPTYIAIVGMIGLVVMFAKPYIEERGP